MENNTALPFGEVLRLLIKEVVKEAVAEVLKNQAEPKKALTNDFGAELLKVDDICQMFGVSRVTVHNWKRKGILQPYYISSRLYFKRSEVEVILNTGHDTYRIKRQAQGIEDEKQEA